MLNMRQENWIKDQKMDSMASSINHNYPKPRFIVKDQIHVFFEIKFHNEKPFFKGVDKGIHLQHEGPINDNKFLQIHNPR